MKKITAGLLAAVCILALVSCSAVKPTDSRVVLTLDGEKLYYDCFRYVVLNSRADLDLGDENYWKDNPDAAETLRENVTEVLRRNRAIEELCKEYGRRRRCQKGYPRQFRPHPLCDDILRRQ